MKKLFVAALVMLSTSAAFAGVSPALKAILGSKNYAECLDVLNSAMEDLQGSEEKATAYNHLVDIALADYQAQASKIGTNQFLIQQGQKDKVEAIDTIAMGDAAINAIKAAEQCFLYDNEPNSKGKIKPRFANNFERVKPAFENLILCGNPYAISGDQVKALKYWGSYLDAKNEPFFKDYSSENEKQFLGQVAFYTAAFAYQQKKFDLVGKYAEFAMQDQEYKKKAFDLKIAAMSEGLTSKEDSIKYKNNLIQVFEENPTNQVVLENLYNVTKKLDGLAAAKTLLDQTLAKDPKNFVALILKGNSQFDERAWQDAIATFKKAQEADPESPFPYFYIGACFQNRASDAPAKTTANVLLEEAIKNYEKAKELDPDQQKVSWGRFRYNSYYARYGENDPKTQAAKADM